jgi:hypothetical protein
MSNKDVYSSNVRKVVRVGKSSNKENVIPSDMREVINSILSTKTEEITLLKTKIQKLEKDNTDKVNIIRNMSESLNMAKIDNDKLYKLQNMKIAKYMELANVYNGEEEVLTPIDPRIDNRSLPDDSIRTELFGARSYVTTAYPGYVWRNCNWYRITPTLQFKSVPISNKSYHNDVIEKLGYDPSLIINDSFQELNIDGVRVFGLYNTTKYVYDIYYITSLKLGVINIHNSENAIVV